MSSSRIVRQSRSKTGAAPAAVLVMLLTSSVLLACQSNSGSADADSPPQNASAPENLSKPKTDAVPLAKPHRKLGPLLASMKRQAPLHEEARAAGLTLTAEGLLVQVAYEGNASDLEASVQSLGLTVLHHYPRYQRLDVVIRDFADLDALTALGSIFRVQALPTAITR